MSQPRGYSTQRGYVGFMPDGSWQLFETEGAYREFLFEEFAEMREAAEPVMELVAS